MRVIYEDVKAGKEITRRDALSLLAHRMRFLKSRKKVDENSLESLSNEFMRIYKKPALKVSLSKKAIENIG